MLEAAMSRQYSANPSEAFFTGGGLHYFANFNKDDDGRSMDLWEATRNSVNLPFIRLMRDIVRHLMFRAPSLAGRILSDAENPQRKTYLQRFADKEGKEFLARFYKKYKGLQPDAATDALINHLSANPRRLAAVFRYLEPTQDIAGFSRWMQSRLADPGSFSAEDFQSLYNDYGPTKFNLSDRGYIAQVHPLELWLVAWLRKHPNDGWDALARNSARERVEVYEWLYSAGRKDAQDSRIQSLLEIEAFQEVHRRWRRLGYPFASLVPSYASAIGSSADRPAALAEMMGIILNDGVKLQEANLQQLEFGADTPYHTVFARKPGSAERIVPAPLAKVVRKALVNVVKQGTARRISGVFKTYAGEVVVGGKTGTGDHRRETFSSTGASARIEGHEPRRHLRLLPRFAVITASSPPSCPAKSPAAIRFTSALPVQLLKTLAPSLQTLISQAAGREPSWEEAVASFRCRGPEAAPNGQAGGHRSPPRPTRWRRLPRLHPAVKSNRASPSPPRPMTPRLRIPKCRAGGRATRAAASKNAKARSRTSQGPRGAPCDRQKPCRSSTIRSPARVTSFSEPALDRSQRHLARFAVKCPAIQFAIRSIGCSFSLAASTITPPRWRSGSASRFPADILGRALSDVTGRSLAHEVAILSTCNRTEVYCSTPEPESMVEWMAEFHSLKPREVRPICTPCPATRP
jgi:hypothetical protein